MNALARQTAFIVPLCMPLIAAATLYRLEWFYPAFRIVVGAHYLPFLGYDFVARRAAQAA